MWAGIRDTIESKSTVYIQPKSVVNKIIETITSNNQPLQNIEYIYKESNKKIQIILGYDKYVIKFNTSITNGSCYSLSGINTYFNSNIEFVEDDLENFNDLIGEEVSNFEIIENRDFIKEKYSMQIKMIFTNGMY